MAVPESDINFSRTTNANSPHEKDNFSQLITKIQNTCFNKFKKHNKLNIILQPS